MAQKISTPRHPVEIVRQQRTGYSRANFAALCDTSYLMLYMVESGRKRTPRKLIDTIVGLGLHTNADVLARECDQWRKHRAARLAAELKATTPTRG